MSIQPNSNAIANEIRMMKDKKFYVLVEGNFDAKFYRQFFNKDKTIVKQCGGKETVIAVYEILKSVLNNVNVIFILDRDFDIFLGTNIVNEKVFYTDFHDLDIMLMQADAFEKFLDYDCRMDCVEKYKQENNVSELKTHIFTIARTIGALRLISYRDAYNFKFKSIDFKNFIDKKKLSLDLNKFIKEVKNKSQCPNIDENEIFNKLKVPINLDSCLLNNGHDIISIMSEGMKCAFSKNSNNKYVPEAIQDKFLYGCNTDKFKQYSLYTSLKSYCDKTNQCML